MDDSILKNFDWGGLYAVHSFIFAVILFRMPDSEKSDEFYARLKKQLEGDVSWPSIYLYKFIVPTKGDAVSMVAEKFDGLGAVISTRESKKGKYTSLSIKVKMADPDAVIQKYKEVGEVPDVISL